MTVIAAWLACAMLAALAVFQVTLIAGAPLGRFAWGGQHRVLPPNLRIGSVVSIVLYGLFAAIVLQRAGLIAILPAPLADVGIWVVVAVLALGIPLNAISRSPPERFIMTPAVGVLAAMVFAVAMG